MTASRWRSEEYEPHYPAPISDLPLFRNSDPGTSRAAAEAIAETLTSLQQRVYQAFVDHGPLTGKELEALPELMSMGFSTARKRASEGLQRGWLKRTGVVRNGCDEMEIGQRGVVVGTRRESREG